MPDGGGYMGVLIVKSLRCLTKIRRLWKIQITLNLTIQQFQSGASWREFGVPRRHIHSLDGTSHTTPPNSTPRGISGSPGSPGLVALGALPAAPLAASLAARFVCVGVAGVKDREKDTMAFRHTPHGGVTTPAFGDGERSSAKRRSLYSHYMCNRW